METLGRHEEKLTELEEGKESVKRWRDIKYKKRYQNGTHKSTIGCYLRIRTCTHTSRPKIYYFYYDLLKKTLKEQQKELGTKILGRNNNVHVPVELL